MYDIVNKVYLFLFIFSTLVILRNVFFIIQSIRVGEKYKIGRLPLTILGISISYFITSIISLIV